MREEFGTIRVCDNKGGVQIKPKIRPLRKRKNKHTENRKERTDR